MIPYALRIHGVRDFPTRQISLGNVDDHVLITGPNGVGKSTLTFCIGAILYSAKVDIEGLRSNNLPENKTWHAHLALLFKNEGNTKIDGPKYISFELVIEQEGKNGLIKREYRIVTGDDENDMTNKTVYTSGHTGGRNFSAYREDLQIKYKVQPDLYYLVWYQQEVNQFASMNPEERFRKFSDMFNITEMQQEWEAALERVKEVDQEIKDLQGIVKVAKQNMSIAETDKNKFLDNQRRIIENGQKQYTYTKTLLAKYEREIKELTTKSAKLEQERDQFKATMEKKQKRLTETVEQESILESANESLSEIIKQHRTEIEQHKHTINEKGRVIHKLDEQLQEVSEKAKWLRYDEKTAHEKLAHKEQEHQETVDHITDLQAEKTALETKEQDKKAAKMKLSYETNDLRDKILAAKKTLEQYKSSHYIKEQINQAEERYNKHLKEQANLQMSITESEQLLEQLRQNKVRSNRQQAGLADLQKQGIEAYTLRDLIELKPDAPLHLEEQIESIKYTIFYNSRRYRPINDLYYVSLQQIIPDKVINESRTLGLQIRDDLSDSFLNHANKALWWIEQFFITSPKINDSILTDERGNRGAQESQQYILSDVAIRRSLESESKRLTEMQERNTQIEHTIKETSHAMSEWHSRLRDLQQAESDLLKESIIAKSEHELQLIRKQLLIIDDELNENEITTTALKERRIQLETEIKNLQDEIHIHDELGALAEQQIEREKLHQEMNGIKQRKIQLQRKHDEARDKASRNSDEIYKLKDAIQQFKSEIASSKNSFNRRIEQLENVQDRLKQRDVEITDYKFTLADLVKVLPKEALVLDESVTIDLSEHRLLSEIDKATIGLNNARTESVNDQAVQNYEKMKADFKRKNSELTKSEMILENNKQRAEETGKQLELTIDMFITKINHLFQTYMSNFQFEGLIDVDRIEDKSGRIKYLLYVKARKVGHQGRLEDVSLKARHGKVGKGVSGGEESLSSLLFALALMKNLDISPSYIVLDEFDSALDDERKHKVFELYQTELQRKLIIVSPKAHDKSYYNYFKEVIVIGHDSAIPQSQIKQIRNVT